MGFRFQKRIKLLPGISLNFSKSGISTSVGVKGARMTFGNGKTRTTVGLPGTGISHTSITSNATPNQPGAAIVPTNTTTQDLQTVTTKSWLSLALSIIGKLLVVASVVGVVIFGFLFSLIGSSSKKGRRRY